MGKSIVCGLERVCVLGRPHSLSPHRVPAPLLLPCLPSALARVPPMLSYLGCKLPPLLTSQARLGPGQVLPITAAEVESS